MQSCNLTPRDLCGRVPVCACFRATCVNSECQKVLLSPSLVASDRLTCVSLPLTCALLRWFGADYADFHGLTSI